MKTLPLNLDNGRRGWGTRIPFGIPKGTKDKTKRDGGMKCPMCGDPRCRVIDSRPTEAGSATRRRRVCMSCEFRFTTLELYRPDVVLDFQI